MRSPVFTYVPGRGASRFFEVFTGNSKTDSAHFYHEEIAYTVAHGAALAGTPAIAFLKSHGIAKAMNSVIASIHSGVAAPFVIFSFEDETGSSSDHPFDARSMLAAVGAEVLGPGDEQLVEALERSLAQKKPVFISVPGNALSDVEASEEIIHSLRTTLFSWIAKAPDPSPLPKHQALLNPLLSRSPGSHAILNRTLPEVPRDLPPHLKRTAESYEPFIKAIRESLATDPAGPEAVWVTGDAGTSSLFGLPPHGLVKVCTHMGGAIPLAMGAALAGKTRTVAITGDFSFISTGCLALSEAVRRNLTFDGVVFANGEASATGGQIVPVEFVKMQIPSGVEIVDLKAEASSDSSALPLLRVFSNRFRTRSGNQVRIWLLQTGTKGQT